MQITLDIPDNLPTSVIQQYISEFETKIKRYQHEHEHEEFKIDEQACLKALAKIKQGDKSGITEIGNVKNYIESLKNEIS